MHAFNHDHPDNVDARAEAAETPSELDEEIAELQRLRDAGKITLRQFLNLRDAAMYAASEA